MTAPTRTRRANIVVSSVILALALVAGACSSDADSTTSAADAESSSTESSGTDETEADDPANDNSTDDGSEAAGSADDGSEAAGSVAVAGCEDIAAQFVSSGSANPDLVDPEVGGTCDGDSIIVASNGIPDYTYIETSPGSPRANDYTFTIPATPTMAETVTEVPNLGTAAIALNGIPIYGPTEGTGGDVLSLGNLSECGSHNGPTGFHIHLILTSDVTDCMFTPAEVAAEPQLVGYAFDGYPIYTGIDQYASSWELTDESLFATDTWAAHSYVEGLGDLDQCNGRTDENGNYAYYTTATFPYVIGCYAGVVDLDAAGAGGGGGRR